MKYLLDGVLANKNTLIEVLIAGNHYNNNESAVESLKRLFFELIKLKTLDISSMGLNKKDCL